MSTTTLRRPRRLSGINAAPQLTAEQLEVLWTAYVADRSNLRLRNQLVEHYVPWVQEMATAMSRGFRLLDRENAVGEVLAALVVSIVPGYDGKSGFKRWARVCAKRKMLDRYRDERTIETTLGHVPRGSSALCSFEVVPDREQVGGDLKFLELTSELTDRQALAVWLRYYRGLSIEEAALTLGVSISAVKSWLRVGLAGLTNRWTNCPREELPA